MGGGEMIQKQSWISKTAFSLFLWIMKNSNKYFYLVIREESVSSRNSQILFKEIKWKTRSENGI